MDVRAERAAEVVGGGEAVDVLAGFRQATLPSWSAARGSTRPSTTAGRSNCWRRPGRTSTPAAKSPVARRRGWTIDKQKGETILADRVLCGREILGRSHRTKSQKPRRLTARRLK